MIRHVAMFTFEACTDPGRVDAIDAEFDSVAGPATHSSHPDHEAAVENLVGPIVATIQRGQFEI